MEVTIYYNPRCSKSRKTLELLQERGIQPEIIEYLKTPPTPSELENILKLLGKSARDLMRKNESEYQEQGLHDPELSSESLITAMHKYPILIERPIVLANGKATIGRPPEAILSIL